MQYTAVTCLGNEVTWQWVWPMHDTMLYSSYDGMCDVSDSWCVYCLLGGQLLVWSRL